MTKSLDPPLGAHRALDTRSESMARGQRVMFSRTDAVTALDRRVPFRLIVNGVSIGDLRLYGVGSAGHRVRLVDESNIAALMPLRGNIEVDDGHGSVAACPGEVIVAGVRRRVTTVGRNYVGLVLLTPADRLAALAQESDCEARLPASARLLRRGDRAGDTLRNFARFLAGDMYGVGVAPRAPQVEAAIGGLLLEMMGDALSSRDAGLRAAAPWQVARAEDILRSARGQPISVAALAARVGTSVRTLQAAFLRHRGVSPSAYANARRLEEIRRRLAAADDGAGVSAIAWEFGVANLGRFAARYRLMFGELPSQTLQRARRRM